MTWQLAWCYRMAFGLTELDTAYTEAQSYLYTLQNSLHLLV